MEAKELGLFIVRLRKENQITQAELAKRLNVTDKAVSRWERGLGFPDINTLEPLADVLGVSLAELMKCDKNDGEKETHADEDAGILASLDIAKIQRRKMINKIILLLFSSIVGLGLVFCAIYLLIKESWSFSFGGNDGPTSVFVAGRINPVVPAVIAVVGVIMLIIGIYTVVRLQNSDK